MLGYINNDVKKFNVFVANCVQLIQDHTGVKQCHYVDKTDNPVNSISRDSDTSEEEKFINGFKDNNSFGTMKVHGVYVTQI